MPKKTEKIKKEETKSTPENGGKKKLALLDMHAIIHRAYHALPDFATRDGVPTGALYGLITMLLKLIGDIKPDYIIACYDLPQATYRHELYEDYKAGRAKTDEALVSQIKKSRDVLKVFGIPFFEVGGFEADDLLGTIVEKVKDDKNISVVICSGDMDTLQLVDDKKVQVYTLKKGIKDTIIYDEDMVRERFGFGPKLLPDYKGFRGDPSDNIIGIKGIGDKTASILIQKFGSVEEIYKALKKNKKQFIEAGLTERIVALLSEHEEEAIFSKMLALIRRDAPMDFKLPAKHWKENVDFDALKKLFQELEFRTLGARVDELVNGKPTQGAFLSSPTVQENVAPQQLKKVSVALWLLDSNITNPSLKDVLEWSGKNTFAEAQDVIMSELKKQNLENVYKDIEFPLIRITEKMKERGVKIDAKYLAELSKEYHKKLSALEAKIWKHAGQEFNINSPKQLGEILFDKMGLAPKNQKKTAGGAKSTKESELEKMKDLHPIVSEILNYRELQKLLSTYIDTIPTLISDDGRLHAEFIQAGSTTGRMASANPNMQNIPIKSELGRVIRNAFVAEKGFSLVELDYSQMELRVSAFLSKDKRMIEIFKNNRDIHNEVAAAVFGVSADKVDYEMRRKAKVINFGIIYGMGVNALKATTGSTREEAQKFYEEYFKNFSGLAEYLENVKKEATAKGYTETFFGRRRLFPDLRSRLPFIKAMAERMAINAPIQGTSADIVKLAMGNVDKYIEKNNLGKDVYLLLQIHDSLMYEIRTDLVKKVLPEIQKIMENVIPPEKIFGIVCKTKASVGENWSEMEEIR
ncbi:MAG: DNA polymerase [Candidatus Pacebacteria bacterium]|nr:DNA polymerase [Candidatus Paceibacterota bacterium]